MMIPPNDDFYFAFPYFRKIPFRTTPGLLGPAASAFTRYWALYGSPALSCISLRCLRRSGAGVRPQSLTTLKLVANSIMHMIPPPFGSMQMTN